MKARKDSHTKGLSKPSSSTESSKPVISFDFCYTSTTGSEEPPAVTLVAVDNLEQSSSCSALLEERRSNAHRALSRVACALYNPTRVQQHNLEVRQPELSESIEGQSAKGQEQSRARDNTPGKHSL